MGRNRQYKKQFEESLYGNVRSWQMYAKRLTELAISMFEYVNLPDSIDPIFMERQLFAKGAVVGFKDDVMGLLFLPVSFQGPLDVYGYPINRTAYGKNGFNEQLTDDNSIIMWNNMVHTNSVDVVEYYARRIWDLDRTIDVNARAQKTPILVQGTETQKLSLINLYKEYDGNAPFIFGDKALDALNSLKAISTQAPYVADKIYQLKTEIWNEALTYLGISNISYQKKERMISDEVLRNQGGTIASRYSRLEARRKGIEEFNRMFGTDIEVYYREDYRQTDDENMIVGDTGEGDIDSMVVDLRTK